MHLLTLSFLTSQTLSNTLITFILNLRVILLHLFLINSLLSDALFLPERLHASWKELLCVFYMFYTVHRYVASAAMPDRLIPKSVECNEGDAENTQMVGRNVAHMVDEKIRDKSRWEER